MSKSYGNTIGLREDPDVVAKKLRTMQTDPARVRREDPGEPTKCPVWDLHQIYSDAATREWAATGCRTAGIGCLDCKKPVVDAIVGEVTLMRERARPFEQDPGSLDELVRAGARRAREVAGATLADVRRVMHLTPEAAP
jgi:tryptophanyl-tRNA synthetase